MSRRRPWFRAPSPVENASYLVVITAMALAAPVVHAENLVVNGEFNQDLAGWSTESASVEGVWAALDFDGSMDSGSVLVTSVESRTGISVGVTQCVEIPPGQPLEFSGALYVPSGQSEEASVGYIMDWREGREGTGCGARVSLIGVNPESGVFDEWVFLEETLEPPEGAESVVIIGRINFAAKNDPNGAFDTYFDAVALPEPANAGLLALGVLAWRARKSRLDG